MVCRSRRGSVLKANKSDALPARLVRLKKEVSGGERERQREQCKSSKAVCERYVREVTEGVVKGAWPAQLKLPVHLSG